MRESLSRRTKKIALLTVFPILASINFLQSAHATTFNLNLFSYTATNDIWGLAFTHDGSNLYFAENGSTTGMRQVTTSNFTSGGSAIPTSSDGFASFRTALGGGWQHGTVLASPTVGKDGHYWVYSTSGNVNRPASPTGGSYNRSSSGVIWAIDTSNNSVSYINTKRSDGNWQNGQMYWATITPDGKYLYAMSWAPDSEGGIEVFKYDLATNTQVGLGVHANWSWGDLSVSNTGFYSVTGTGITYMAIDGDNTRATRDSLPSTLTVNWTGTPLDYSTVYSGKIVNGELYITTNENKIAVIDLSTNSGTVYTITNTYNSGSLYGQRMGADGCIYAFSDADKSLVRVNMRTKSVTASTGAITGFAPYWEQSFAMNPDGTILAIAPKTRSLGGLYYLNISGSECGGAALYATGSASSGGGGGGSGGSDDSAARAEEERKRQTRIAEARAEIVRKSKSNTEITVSDVSSADYGKINDTSIALVNKEISAIDVDKKSKIEELARIIRKYQTYEILESASTIVVPAKVAIDLGVLPSNTPQATYLLYKLRKLNPAERSSIAAINSFIAAETKIYEARKLKLKEIRDR